MYDISKELLSEVLGINDIVHVQKEGSCSIFISRANNSAYIISLNDLFFKCKEWVLKQGYRIIIDCSKDIKVGIRILKNGRDVYSNENKTEVEAIVKACQWILEQRSKTC